MGGGYIRILEALEEPVRLLWGSPKDGLFERVGSDRALEFARKKSARRFVKTARRLINASDDAESGS